MSLNLYYRLAFLFVLMSSVHSYLYIKGKTDVRDFRNELNNVSNEIGYIPPRDIDWFSGFHLEPDISDNIKVLVNKGESELTLQKPFREDSPDAEWSIFNISEHREGEYKVWWTSTINPSPDADGNYRTFNTYSQFFILDYNPLEQKYFARYNYDDRVLLAKIAKKQKEEDIERIRKAMKRSNITFKDNIRDEKIKKLEENHIRLEENLAQISNQKFDWVNLVFALLNALIAIIMCILGYFTYLKQFSVKEIQEVELGPLTDS